MEAPRLGGVWLHLDVDVVDPDLDPSGAHARDLAGVLNAVLRGLR